MATSNSRLAYEDCFEALDRALASSRGVRITVESEGAAYHLRNRLNAARTKDREANAETYDDEHPLHGSSQYDSLVIKLRLAGEKPVILIEKIRLNATIEEI